jgi:hypothetical protein
MLCMCALLHLNRGIDVAKSQQKYKNEPVTPVFDDRNCRHIYRLKCQPVKINIYHAAELL